VHLTFLVDVSGSMNRPDKLGLAKQSLKMLTNQLRKGDSVALVTYAGSNRVVLPMTDASNTAMIWSAIDNLRSGGGTAMASGMKLAYQEALKGMRADHVNRVLVLSDGDANIGSRSHAEILQQIKAYVDEGVTMTTVGFGMGNYRDTLMEQLANKGNGNYYYIDSLKEARKVFSDQANGTLEVIAKDVKLQVEFNPKAISAYRLIGYENRDIADQDFRNDKVDAGEIGAGHSVTALYEIKVDNLDLQNLGFVRIRAKKPDGYKAAEQTFGLNGRHFKARLSQASKDFQFASAVAGFAELLRKSPYANKLSYDLIHEGAQGSLDGKSDRKEFLGLVKKAKTLKR
jgi:Ca-activated chloride channel family protein